MDVIVPKWGLTMDDAVLTRWLKSVGDRVIEGETLAEIETDKATGELEAPAAGIVAALLVDENAEVSPGQVVARLDKA